MRMKKLNIFTDNEDSIIDTQFNQGYDSLRSHYVFLEYLAKELEFEDIVDYHFTSKHTKLHSSTHLSMNKEFTYSLYDGKSPYIGVILHSRVTSTNLERLKSFIKYSDSIIYYNSDPEFNTGPNCDNMLLYFLSTADEEFIKLFKSKVKVIITGLSNQVEVLDIKLKDYKIPVIFIPQLINREIRRLENPKYYDAFVINNSYYYKEVIDKLLAAGLSVFTLVKDKEAIIPGVSAHLCKGMGIEYRLLLDLVSRCKYYVGTNTYWGRSVEDTNTYYAPHSLSSKYLESYYGRTIPVSASKNPDQVVKYIQCNNRYKTLDYYDTWMKSKFSIESNQINIDKVCKLLKS